ncbi:hypothetical protein WN943_011260 [Citrus x changshan-huyou]
MNKLKEAAATIDRTIGATACEIKPDHMTSVFLAFDAVPYAAVAIFFLLVP